MILQDIEVNNHRNSYLPIMAKLESNKIPITKFNGAKNSFVGNELLENAVEPRNFSEFLQS